MSDDPTTDRPAYTGPNADRVVRLGPPPATPTAERLRRLRERAGCTIVECAKAAGFSGPSGYARYESEITFTKPHISVELARALAPLFVGRGSPLVTAEEVWALAGVEPPSLREATAAEIDEWRRAAAAPQGWQCPLCRTVYAPHVVRCAENH